MILVGDVHVRPRRDVVTDLDRLVPDDVTAAADVATFADADHDVVLDRLPWRHADGEAHVRADQRVRTDVDVTLAEDRARREGDHAVRAHEAEAPAALVVGRHRAHIADPAPG